MEQNRINQRNSTTVVYFLVRLAGSSPFRWGDSCALTTFSTFRIAWLLVDSKHRKQSDPPQGVTCIILHLSHEERAQRIQDGENHDADVGEDGEPHVGNADGAEYEA